MTNWRRLPAPGGATYSEAVVVEGGGVRWIYVAGQTPRETPSQALPPDLEGQAEVCFRQIETTLRECGAELRDVVQITIYLTDLSDYAGFAEVRGRIFEDDPPASAAVGVASLLGDVLIEIAAVAAVRGS